MPLVRQQGVSEVLAVLLKIEAKFPNSYETGLADIVCILNGEAKFFFVSVIEGRTMESTIVKKGVHDYEPIYGVDNWTDAIKQFMRAAYIYPDSDTQLNQVIVDTPLNSLFFNGIIWVGAFSWADVDIKRYRKDN